MTRLNQLRRALRERGWVNSPWFGWTCPQHQPRSGKDAVLEEAVAVVERRMHVLGEGRNPRDPWELD